MSVLQDHPLRKLLADEVHARPYRLLRAPVRLSHLAVLTDELSGDADRAHVAGLCRRLGAPPPEEGATHYSGPVGPFHLKWERHTEFSSYTFYVDGPFDHPFDDPAIGHVPEDWLAALPGQVLVATHLGLEDEDAGSRSFTDLAALFGDNTVTGSGMYGGEVLVWTDFRLHGDGFGRTLIRNRGLNQRQAGRLIQRLLEVGTYRMMAMLGFPLARDALPKVASSERELSALIAAMADVETVEDERNMLKRLSELAARAETLSAKTSYRFAATGAYYELVRRRIKELREIRLDDAQVRGLQPPGEFVNRRLKPAMETCLSVSARQEALSRRIGRASDLLRTRVNVALEEQNRDLLQSMDRRARVQLRLQETVEGLSVVAISYYLLGLVAYLAKGAKAVGFKINPDIAAGLALPLIAWAVWMGVKRLRLAVTGKDEH